MIEYIPHNEIDRKKYDVCVQISRNTLLYATSWFLDIETSKQWDILMAKDYNYVMPLTYFRLKNSFWKKTLLTPYHAQQLGIINRLELTQEINDAFLKTLLDHKPKEYSFNYSQNSFLATNKFLKKNNFILDLNKPYDDLFQNFSKTRRRWVRKSQKNNLHIQELTDIENFLSFQKKHLQLNESFRVINKRQKLLKAILNKNLGNLIGIYNENHLIGMLFYIQYRDRIYYMQSVINENGKRLHATDFALNNIIKKYANQPFTLDFEGSMIEGVANYMKSFGAVNEPYYSIKT